MHNCTTAKLEEALWTHKNLGLLSSTLTAYFSIPPTTYLKQSIFFLKESYLVPYKATCFFFNLRWQTTDLNPQNYFKWFSVYSTKKPYRGCKALQKMPLPHKGLDYTLQFSQESLQVISQIWEPLRLTMGCRIRPPLSLARWPLWTSLMAALSHPRETHPNGHIWFATWVHSKEGKVCSKKSNSF